MKQTTEDYDRSGPQSRALTVETSSFKSLHEAPSMILATNLGDRLEDNDSQVLGLRQQLGCDERKHKHTRRCLERGPRSTLRYVYRNT